MEIARVRLGMLQFRRWFGNICICTCTWYLHMKTPQRLYWHVRILWSLYLHVRILWQLFLQCTAVGFWESISSPVNVSRKVTSNLCLLNQNLLEMRGVGGASRKLLWQVHFLTEIRPTKWSENWLIGRYYLTKSPGRAFLWSNCTLAESGFKRMFPICFAASYLYLRKLSLENV